VHLAAVEGQPGGIALVQRVVADQQLGYREDQVLQAEESPASPRADQPDV